MKSVIQYIYKFLHRIQNDMHIRNRILMILCTGVLSFVAHFGCMPAEEPFIGIQLYSVRDAMSADPAGTLEALGKMEYRFIEAAGYSDGKFYGIEPEEFRKLVESAGMVFLSSHTGRDLPDESNLDETMTWWDECIEAHAAAGVKYLVQPWMGQSGYENLEGLKSFCDYFNAIGEKCRAKGITFGYHNHDGEFGELEGEVIYDFMLRNTDPDKVMFQMDVYWAYAANSDAVVWFAKYPGRFELWHVKDEEELGRSGKIDFERLYEYADKAGLKYSVVEVEKYNYEPLESVRLSLEYLLGLSNSR
jgi:sugar phosphate isomerase/epimerase